MNIVELEYHFGKSLSQAPLEVRKAGALDNSSKQSIKNLHSKGLSNIAIEERLKETQGKGSPTRKTIAKLLAAEGLTANGKKFGE